MVYTRGGGVISESYLPNASVVGLFLQKEDGTPYDNLPYNNIPYVATGTGATQTWAPQSADKQILLSATEGKAYAYYPYNAENTSFSSIHLDASRQDDVMYTSTASNGLNDKNADASFELQHALAVMKVKVKKGSYTGAGNVTSCSISGSPIGLTGKLDGTTGKLSGVTTGTVSVNKSYKISTTATDHDIIFVPTTTAGQVTVGLTMDGKEYTTTTTSSDTFTFNQCYTLNLTVDDNGATLSGIEVGNWTMNGEGNEIVTAGGYKISFEGDCVNIGFRLISESNGTVVISAYAPEGYTTKQVVAYAGASLSQSISGNILTLTISSITSDVTITMNGLALNWIGARQNDGVYAIKDDGSLVASAVATDDSYAGVGFAFKGKVYQISNTYITSYWQQSVYGDIEGITNYDTSNGTDYQGYLTGSSTPQLSIDYTTGTDGALSDFNGKRNTDRLIDKRQAIGKSTATFRTGLNNQGFTDWYVPAEGQLACMCLYKTEINTILAKCPGATQIPMTDPESWHWSTSEEEGETYAWGMKFSNDQVYSFYKLGSHTVRFIRDISD